MSRMILFILVLVQLTVLSAQAGADMEVLPRDYTRAVAGGKYTFVMLAPKGSHADARTRRKYHSSGLYPAKSTKPLWAVDWNCHSEGAVVSSDGHHMVAFGGMPGIGNYDAWAATFYIDGKEVKHYTVKDLVRKPEDLPRSVSHYHWCDNGSLDDKKGILTLGILTGNNYSDQRKMDFDIRTGKITRILEPSGPVTRTFVEAAAVYGGLALALMLVLWPVRKGLWMGGYNRTTH